MTKTIGNPLSWSVRTLRRAGHGAADMTDRMGGDGRAVPEVRRLSTDDLLDALHAGLDDFKAFRTDVLALVLLYPVMGGLLVWFTLDSDLLHIAFPMLAGFALVGPLAAVGLYEMSRRRERGEQASWGDALDLVFSPVMAPIVMLGVCLLGVFVIWLVVADRIYDLTIGPAPPASIMAFAGAVFGTPAGWAMIAIGMGAGLIFAAVVLAATVVSFPMLIDRNVGLPRAVATSVEVTRRNPQVILTWGLIVAVSLGLGAIPALLGLMVVMPVLGHATWHLYRRAVVWNSPQDTA